MIPRDKPPYYVAWDYAENQPRDAATRYLCVRARDSRCIYIREYIYIYTWYNSVGVQRFYGRATSHGDDRVFSRKKISPRFAGYKKKIKKA